MPKTILLVDDDELLRRSLAYTLEQAGYQVQTAASAEAAVAIVQVDPPDLVLLDIGLPGMDGLEAVRHIRGISPIIFVTARRRELDEILGLELGAEDYITKPFDPDVLLARIRTVLRRAQAGPAPAQQAVHPASPPGALTLGDLVIDARQHTVTRNGKPINLSPLEFRLLLTLAQEAERVISIEELLTRVWGADYGGEPQTVYIYIRALREKLEENPQTPQRIRTVRGAGYRFVPQAPTDA